MKGGERGGGDEMFHRVEERKEELFREENDKMSEENWFKKSGCDRWTKGGTEMFYRVYKKKEKMFIEESDKIWGENWF